MHFNVLWVFTVCQQGRAQRDAASGCLSLCCIGVFERLDIMAVIFSNKVIAHGFMFSVTKYATDIFRDIPSSTPLNEYLSWMNSPYLSHGSIKRTVMSDETVSGLRWLLTCCTVLLSYHNDSPVLTAADRTRDSYVCNSEVLLYCFCFCVHCEMRVIQSHLLEQTCYKIKCWLTDRQIDWQT